MSVCPAIASGTALSTEPLVATVAQLAIALFVTTVCRPVDVRNELVTRRSEKIGLRLSNSFDERRFDPEFPVCQNSPASAVPREQPAPSGDITRLLHEWQSGEREALDQL